VNIKDKIASRLRRGIQWLMDGSEAVSQHNAADFAADAQWATGQQQAKGSRLLVWASLVVVLVLLVWACLGHIDEVVRGQGKVVPSRQVQVVQSLDGGVVEEILVRPGQRVEEGQVLLRIDPTRYSASLGENKAEVLSLKAKAARLEALASGEMMQMPDEVMTAAPKLASVRPSRKRKRRFKKPSSMCETRHVWSCRMPAPSSAPWSRGSWRCKIV